MKHLLLTLLLSTSPTISQTIETECGIYKEAAYRDALQFGMTTQCVESTWGKPVRKNISQRRNYTFEQWIYYRNGVFYLYFKNGVLDSAQKNG